MEIHLKIKWGPPPSAVCGPRVLLIFDSADYLLIPHDKKLERYCTVVIVDFSSLEKYVGLLKGLIRDQQIEIVIFSQNGQVGQKILVGHLVRELGVGYSTFSGVDDHLRNQEMQECFEDLLTALEREEGRH